MAARAGRARGDPESSPADCPACRCGGVGARSSVDRRAAALLGHGRRHAGRHLQLEVPVGARDGVLDQLDDAVQEVVVEGDVHALPDRRQEAEHVAALLVAPRLDARDEQRVLAERPLALRFLVGLGEVRLPDRLLVLEAEQRALRLGVLLQGDLGRRLGHVEQQRPQPLDAAAREPDEHLAAAVGREPHQQPVVLGDELDLELMETHSPAYPVDRMAKV